MTSRLCVEAQTWESYDLCPLGFVTDDKRGGMDQGVNEKINNCKWVLVRPVIEVRMSTGMEA